MREFPNSLSQTSLLLVGTVEVTKVNICNCNYTVMLNFYDVVTGDYSRIVITIMHQLLFCNKFALFLYYNM